LASDSEKTQSQVKGLAWPCCPREGLDSPNIGPRPQRVHETTANDRLKGNEISFAEPAVALVSAYNEPPGHAADAFVSEPYDPIEITQLVEEQGSSTR